MKPFLSILWIVYSILSTQATNVTLPAIYADHMVIQTDQPFTISGTISPVPEEVSIKLAGQVVTIIPGLFGS